MKKVLAAIICIALLLVTVSMVAAQYEKQLQKAQQYEKAGRLEEALRLYQELLVERPGDKELLTRIQGVYKELKWYPQLIELLLDRLQKDPGDFELRLNLGEAYFLSGQLQRAGETWMEALRLAPRQESSFIRVSGVFLERGMLSEAEDILLQGRQALGDGTLFADLLARISELRADYGTAAREYMVWLIQDLRRLSFVDAQLARFPDVPEVHLEVENALREAISSSPEQQVFRQLLSQHLIRMGKPQEAYGEILVLEDETASSGYLLLKFSAQCAELGYHQVAIQACQEVLTRYPKSPVSRQAQLAIGQNMVSLKKYEGALNAYRELIVQHPQSAEAIEALYSRGEIYFLYQNHVDSALTVYRTILDGSQNSSRALDAAFRVGDCLSVQGHLDQARAEYSNLAYGSFPEEIREKAAYKLAELHFLEGNFGEAKEAFDQLASGYTQGFYVNDALVQVLFIEEELAGDEEALKAYAAAMRLVHQRQYQSAVESFERIGKEYPSAGLGDEVLLQTAMTREQVGQYQAAVADLKFLISQHPQSRLCPEALRRIGQIYETHLDDLAAARQAYEQLLADYPRYLFLDEIRRTLRRLKGQDAS